MNEALQLEQKLFVVFDGHAVSAESLLSVVCYSVTEGKLSCLLDSMSKW